MLCFALQPARGVTVLGVVAHVLLLLNALAPGGAQVIHLFLLQHHECLQPRRQPDAQLVHQGRHVWVVHFYLEARLERRVCKLTDAMVSTQLHLQIKCFRPNLTEFFYFRGQIVVLLRRQQHLQSVSGPTFVYFFEGPVIQLSAPGFVAVILIAQTHFRQDLNRNSLKTHYDHQNVPFEIFTMKKFCLKENEAKRAKSRRHFTFSFIFLVIISLF